MPLRDGEARDGEARDGEAWYLCQSRGQTPNFLDDLLYTIEINCGNLPCKYAQMGSAVCLLDGLWHIEVDDNQATASHICGHQDVTPSKFHPSEKLKVSRLN